MDAALDDKPRADDKPRPDALRPDAMARTVYRPKHPLSLRLTLGPLFRGAGNPTCRSDASGIWLTQRTPHGSATLRLQSIANEVHATAWGEGAEWAIAAVPTLLGRDDDWNGLDLSRHPALGVARHKASGLRLVRTNLVLEALIPAVFEQKVTTVQAWRAWRQLVTRHGDAAPGPGPSELRVFPTAAAWRAIPSWEWHRAGVEPARSRAALAVASVATALERQSGSGCGEPFLAALRSVPGIGPWTAAETSQRTHGDPDTVSVGDYHLPAIVGWALIGKPVDDDGMLQLLEPFAGNRQRVMRLILASGFHKPRFAPRVTIQDHRNH